MVTWKGLGNPRPRSEPRPYAPVEWLEGEAIAFPHDATDASGFRGVTRTERSLDSLARERRTRYSFGAMDFTNLGKLFALTSQVLFEGSSQLGFPLSRRPAPSAGAIHPIHVVTHLVAAPRLRRYDAATHTLREIFCDVNVDQLRDAVDTVVCSSDAVLLMFVAEPGRTCAKYEEAESLVWRDAGILQGYFSMTAEALGLNFALLGITGEPWATQLVQEGGLAGVGVALVGARP